MDIIAYERSATLPPVGRILTSSKLTNTLVNCCFPTQCCSCGRPGRLLCERCEQQLKRIDPRFACPFCAAPFGSLVCTECSPQPYLRMEVQRTAAALLFTPQSAAMIRSYKDGLDRRLIPHLVDYLIEAFFAYQFDGAGIDVITTVPAREEALRLRGFDHMALVASAMASRLSLPFQPLLCRLHARDQRTLGRILRFENMKHAFLYDSRVSLRTSNHVLLIDDVMTTGATVWSAVETIRQATSARVSVLVFARAYAA